MTGSQEVAAKTPFVEGEGALLPCIVPCRADPCHQILILRNLYSRDPRAHETRSWKTCSRERSAGSDLWSWEGGNSLDKGAREVRHSQQCYVEEDERQRMYAELGISVMLSSRPPRGRYPSVEGR